jgi:lactocepin
VPYSPRRQGAGLVQIEDAIKNLVTITGADGNAAVALKEMGKTKTFTLNLKNYDATPVTYSISDIGGVLTEQNAGYIKTMSYDVKINGATIVPDKDSVTVPANGTAIVNVTITLPDTFATEQFVEGFVKFTTTDKPSLVVPYIGFYGDWSKQESIDKPVWDLANSYYGNTKLLTLGDDKNTLNYLGFADKYYDPDENYPIIDSTKIAISPNGDGNNENVFPFLTFLRNAKTMNIQLLDKDNEVVSQVATDNNIRKNVFAAKGDKGYMQSMNWMWDGKIFNDNTGKMEVAPEGQYYLDYVTKVDLATAKDQHFTMPVKVDLTAPEVTVKSTTSVNTTNYKLEWTVADSLSGDKGVSLVALNGKIQEVPVTNNNGVYSCNLTLEKDKVNNIEVLAADNALNIAVKEVTVVQQSGEFKVTFNNLTSRMNVTKSDLTVTGSVSYIPSEFKIAGQDVVINRADLTFSVDLKFTEGRNIVPIHIIGTDGRTVLQDFSYKVDCDTIAPVLTLTSPVIASDNKIYTDKDVITIAGKVSDNTTGYKLYINGAPKLSIELDGEIGNVATERSFSYEVPVTDNSYVEVKVVDLFGNETIKNINVIVDKTAPVITVTGVEDGKLYKTNVTPVFNANEGTVTATLNGKAYKGEEITVGGEYELIVSATNLAGNASTYKVNFTIDNTAPVITVTGVEDGKLYKTNVTPVFNANEGTVTATLNGKAYKGEKITVDGKYELIVNAIDLAGNTVTYKVNFTIDTTPPAIVGVSYQGHVQNIGWQASVKDGVTAGTTGQSLREEALKIQLVNAPAGLKIKYRTHVQNIGWQGFVYDGAMSGTQGQSLRGEAVQIELEGTDADKYSVKYQVHVQNEGWQPWVSDGKIAGTTGQSLRMEAIKIVIVAK